MDFEISNIAGGDARQFRIVTRDGQRTISDAALRHARGIRHFGGPAFSGPAGDEARRIFDEIEEDAIHAEAGRGA